MQVIGSVFRRVRAFFVPAAAVEPSLAELNNLSESNHRELYGIFVKTVAQSRIEWEQFFKRLQEEQRREHLQSRLRKAAHSVVDKENKHRLPAVLPAKYDWELG